MYTCPCTFTRIWIPICCTAGTSTSTTAHTDMTRTTSTFLNFIFNGCKTIFFIILKSNFGRFLVFFKIFENSIWTQKCLLWLFGISPLVTLTWSGHGWPWLLTSYLEKHYHSFRHINKKKNENKCAPNKDALFKLFLTSFWLIFDPKLGHFIPKKLQLVHFVNKNWPIFDNKWQFW